MSTATTRYHWNKPDVSGSANTWGSILNGTTDKIDEQVYQNQQGVNQVGFVAMFAGKTAPANWMICDGASLNQNTYKTLFDVIGTAYGQTDGPGSFNLPNLNSRFPIGAGDGPPGPSGGAVSYTLQLANLPSHAHTITDVVHNHTLNQSPHAHGDAGHTHPDNGSYQDSHHHTVSNVPSFTAGAGLAGGAGALIGTQTTSDAQPALHIGIGTGYANTQPINANVTIVASGTNLKTTNAAGSGAPFNVIPPYLFLTFIIRYQ